MVWEFALEPIIASEIENESTRENWEHVLTVLSISALALIYPFLLLQRKIDQERRTEGLYRKSEERLGGAIESLREGFALYDADDRLISFNKKYQQLRPQAKEIMERRGTFKDVIRSSVAEGKIIEAIGREEEFIQERLEQHRNPKGSVIRRFSDDTWYRIEEVRTPEGGA